MGRGRDMEQRWGDVAPVHSRCSFLRNLTHIIYGINAWCSDAVHDASSCQGPSQHW